MSNDTEFREELKRVVRQTDPAPDELRDAADDLKRLADRWEDADDVL